MLAVIGSLAGFFSSFVPEIFHFLRDKRDKEHELKLIDRQIEALKAGNHARLEEVQIQAGAFENSYLYQHAAPVGVRWVDSLSALVRPLITYTFFLLYTAIKILAFAKAGDLSEVWTSEDQGIFCAVIGFWFGQRALGRNRSNGNSNGRNGYQYSAG